LLALLGIGLTELPKSTEITLQTESSAAFVGESVHFEGVLTSVEEPLGGREVDLQVNGARHTTVTTDARGHYEGVLMVPYQYVAELSLRALYYPHSGDLGQYLASLSPPVMLGVLFHETELEVHVAGRSHPGRETAITGRFLYGDDVTPIERDITVYLDDVFVAPGVAQGSFSLLVSLPANTETGWHSVTITAAGKGRYAPAVATAALDVVQAAPALEISLPGMIVMPGSVSLVGTARSEVGPLDGASLLFTLGRSSVETVTAASGDFDARLPVGMTLALVGSQDLVIEVAPQEPWHETVQITRQVMTLNVVNLGALVVVLAFVGAYLPGRLKGRFGAFVRRAPRPVVRSPGPVPTPPFPAVGETLVPAVVPDEPDQTPGSSIFRWYRLAARLLQRVAKVLLRPQQTLREFASECSAVLGPAASRFTELTRIVERALYSGHEPTPEDAEQSQHLSHTIEEALQREDV